MKEIIIVDSLSMYSDTMKVFQLKSNKTEVDTNVPVVKIGKGKVKKW